MFALRGSVLGSTLSLPTSRLPMCACAGSAPTARQYDSPDQSVARVLAAHLPPDVNYGRVAGVGMNARELEANEVLTEFVQVEFVLRPQRHLSLSRVAHCSCCRCARSQADLNSSPKLAFDDASFDAVLCVVSIDYLTKPLEIVNEMHRGQSLRARATPNPSHRHPHPHPHPHPSIIPFPSHPHP
mgnify:CR=1 FL=1